MFKPRLVFAIALVVPCIVGEAKPATAQTGAVVTLSAIKGTTNKAPLSGVSWTRGVLTLEGRKPDGSTFKCYLKSTDNHLLLSIQQRLMEAKTTTSAICLAPTTQTSQWVTVDLANQTSMNYFSMTLMR